MNIKFVSSHLEVPIDYTGIIVFEDTTREYYKEGCLHRLNGPAIEYSKGKTSFFLCGFHYEESEYWEKMKYMEEYLSNLQDSIRPNSINISSFNKEDCLYYDNRGIMSEF